jgi:hypothetical protein
MYEQKPEPIIMSEAEKQEATMNAQGTAFQYAYLRWLFETPRYQTHMKKKLKEKRIEVELIPGKFFKEDDERSKIRNEMSMEWNETYSQIFRTRWKQDEAFRDQAMAAIQAGGEEREQFFQQVHETNP